MLHETEQIVTVGGGTGSPVINESLLRTNLVSQIDAIAAMFDDGGATGRRRLDSLGREPAYSDAMRIMLSLVHPDDKQSNPYRTLSQLFHYRDKRERVPAQGFMNFLFSEQLGFARTETILKTLGIRFRGRVLPSTTQSSHIGFATASGIRYIGEHELDDRRTYQDTILHMYLNPPADAYGPAAEAIKNAQLIILSCGSLHGSVLCNFLPRGMKEALSKSRAKMFLVTNLVSQRIETHDFSPQQFIEMTQEYTGKRPDALIVPDISRKAFESLHPDVTFMYNREHSHFLGWEAKELYRAQEEGVQIITHSATSIVDVIQPVNNHSNHLRIIRHDPKKLAEALKPILSPATSV